MKKSIAKHIYSRKELFTETELDDMFESIGLMPYSGSPGDLAKYTYRPIRITPSAHPTLYFQPDSEHSYLSTKANDSNIATIDKYGRILFGEKKSVPTMLVVVANKNNTAIKEVKITNLPRTINAKTQYWTMKGGVISNVGYPNVRLDAKATPAHKVEVVGHLTSEPAVIKSWTIVDLSNTSAAGTHSKFTDEQIEQLISGHATMKSQLESIQKHMLTTDSMKPYITRFDEIDKLNAKQTSRLDAIDKLNSSQTQLIDLLNERVAGVEGTPLIKAASELNKATASATITPPEPAKATEAKVTTETKTAEPAKTNNINKYVGKFFRILSAQDKSFCIDTGYNQTKSADTLKIYKAQTSLHRNQIWTVDKDMHLKIAENTSYMYADSKPLLKTTSTPTANAYKWGIDQYNKIYPVDKSNKVLAVSKCANDIALVLEDRKDTKLQSWTLQEVTMPANYKLSGDVFVEGEPRLNIKDFSSWVDKKVVISCVYNPEFLLHAMNVQKGKGGDVKNDRVALWTVDCNQANIQWKVDKFGRILLASDAAWCLYAPKVSNSQGVVLKKVANIKISDKGQYWQLDKQLIRSQLDTNYGLNISGGAAAIKKNGLFIMYKLTNANNEQFALNEFEITANKCCLMANNKYLKGLNFSESNINKAERVTITFIDKQKWTVAIKSLSTNKFYTAKDNKKDVTNSATERKSWEVFNVYPTYGGYAIKSCHGKWLALDSNNRLVQADKATPIKRVVVEKYTYKKQTRGIIKANFIPVEKKSLFETFTSFFTGKSKKEAFLDANVSVQNTETNHNTTVNQQAYNAIINNKDLYTEISNNINKANEIINKAKNEINKKTEAAATAQTKQSNTMTGKSFKVSGSENVSFELSNKNKTSIQLMVYAESLSQLDSTKYNKAMIADMIGMTSSSDTDNTAKTGSESSAAASSAASVETGVEQYTIEAFADADVSVQNTETNINNETNTSTTNVTSSDTTERQIQSYCEHLSESTQNIDENAQNLCNNLSAVADVDQSNEFSYEEVDISNSKNVPISLLNESDQQVVMEYKEFMTQVAKTIAESATENTTTTTTSTASETTNGSETTSKSDGSTESSTGVTAKVSQIGGIVAIIVAIIVLIIVIFGCRYLFKCLNNKKVEAAPESELDDIASVPASVPAPVPAPVPIEATPEYKQYEENSTEDATYSSYGTQNATTEPYPSDSSYGTQDATVESYSSEPLIIQGPNKPTDASLDSVTTYSSEGTQDATMESYSDVY